MSSSSYPGDMTPICLEWPSTGGQLLHIAPWYLQPHDAVNGVVISLVFSPLSPSTRAMVATQDPDCQFQSDQSSWWSLECKKTNSDPPTKTYEEKLYPWIQQDHWRLHLTMFLRKTLHIFKLCLNQNLTISLTWGPMCAVNLLHILTEI